MRSREDLTTPAAAEPPRVLDQLSPAQALGLLASVPYGRIVFTANALPAVRPVNHIVDGGNIIIRSDLGSKVSRLTGRTGMVVAYEADEIDPLHRLGWSVVVTGFARPVTDPADIARYERSLVPWIDRSMDTVISIRPEIVSGFRLMEPEPAA